ILSGNTLYGTAEGGDSSAANGNVFSLALVFAPRLNIIRSGTNVIVTWTNMASGFTLLFTTNLVSPAVWTTNSPLPVIINGQNTVTNPISGTKKFYRRVDSRLNVTLGWRRQGFVASRFKLPRTVKKFFSLRSMFFFNSKGSSNACSWRNWVLMASAMSGLASNR